jgi:hypothetical protein
MKKLFYIFTLSLVLTSSLVQPAAAQSDTPSGNESYTGAAICLPGVYLQDPGTCLPLGPSEYLTRMAKVGLSFPARPLPAYSPDPKLSEISFKYAKLTDNVDVPFYSAPSYDSSSRMVGGDTKYISYTDIVNADPGIFLHSTSGAWVDGNYTQRISFQTFQGLLFTQTPRNKFGWVRDLTMVKKEPGYFAPETGRQLNRFEVVQVFDKQEKDNTDWLMIGQDEWIEGRMAAVVYPNTTAPAGVTTGRWIEVNLYEQTLAVYDQNRLVFATPVSTGLEPFYTQPGLFQIYKKKEIETMSGDFSADGSGYYYLEDVPWTMYFDKARALHGAYWHARLGNPISHGCVNMSIGDAHWLYDWAHEGDYVYVWDPSGATPTDPSYYTSGGF